MIRERGNNRLFNFSLANREIHLVCISHKCNQTTVLFQEHFLIFHSHDNEKYFYEILSIRSVNYV